MGTLGQISSEAVIVENLQNNQVSELSELLVNARTPCLLVGNFAPGRANEAARWLETLDSLRTPLFTQSIRAATGDTAKHRGIQERLSSLRTEIVRAHESDVPAMSASLAPDSSRWLLPKFKFQEVIILATLLVALMSFVASVTDWFTRRVPVYAGFVVDDDVKPRLSVSTGDPAKRIIFGFRNESRTTLTALMIEVQLLEPLSLSATGQAVEIVPGSTKYGRDREARHYLIQHWDVDILGEDLLSAAVEINTAVLAPGTYGVLAAAYSRESRFQVRRVELQLHVT